MGRERVSVSGRASLNARVRAIWSGAGVCHLQKSTTIGYRCAIWEDGKVGLEIHDFGNIALI